MITCVCFAQACFIILDWISSGGTTMKQSFFASIVLQPVVRLVPIEYPGFPLSVVMAFLLFNISESSLPFTYLLEMTFLVRRKGDTD